MKTRKKKDWLPWENVIILFGFKNGMNCDQIQKTFLHYRGIYAIRLHAKRLGLKLGFKSNF